MQVFARVSVRNAARCSAALLATLLCGCNAEIPGKKMIVESGWDLRGTVRDARTAEPIEGAEVAVGFVYKPDVDWSWAVVTDSSGSYRTGAIGGHPERVRFVAAGYDTLDVAMADSAVVETSAGGNASYRLDARLTSRPFHTRVPPRSGPE